MAKPEWLTIIIHPQTGTFCDALRPRDPFAWPLSGFSFDGQIWSVPRLKGARLVDCRCGKTGVQPKTWEDVVRYVPGAVLVEEKGIVTVHLSQTLATQLEYPTGSGEDEE